MLKPIPESTLSRKLHAMEVRDRVEQKIRQFFRQRDFKETRTPLLVKSPGMETHIRPFKVEKASHDPHAPPVSKRYEKIFLPTSPEFAMKRLLAGGLDKIFQICPAFRDEPESTTHRPEFTLLEWYRAHARYEDIMLDVEQLIEALALELFGKPEIYFQGNSISVKAPWPRFTIRKLFIEYVDIDLAKCADPKSLAAECQKIGIQTSSDSWDDMFFQIWLNLIEPKLPKTQAIFVNRYPGTQAALSIIDQDPDGSYWAKRFEVYAGGLELGNAFEELTDPIEQRRRFEKDMQLRNELYGKDFPASPIDEEFLAALEAGMPPSSGIALGVDRLVMLLADESDINYTFWL